MAAKRLQVLLDESELRVLKRLAAQERMTVAEWVRRLLRAEYRRQPSSGADKKLAILRRAARGTFPTGDIDQMLAEIETGYAAGDHP